MERYKQIAYKIDAIEFCKKHKNVTRNQELIVRHKEALDKIMRTCHE